MPRKNWKVINIITVIKPETKYEGVHLQKKPSEAGTAAQEENALRDPFIFEDNNKLYMFYCVKGESGIALSELELGLI